MLIVCPNFLGTQDIYAGEHPPEHSGLNSATFTAQWGFFMLIFILRSNHHWKKYFIVLKN